MRLRKILFNTLPFQQLQHPLTPLSQCEASPDGIGCIGLVIKALQRLGIVDGNQPPFFQTLKDQTVFFRTVTVIFQIHRDILSHFPGYRQEGDLTQSQQHLDFSPAQFHSTAAAGTTAAPTAAAAAISASAHTQTSLFFSIITGKPQNVNFHFPVATEHQIGYTESQIIHKGVTVMPVVHITKDNFESIVNQNEKSVLIDFWAPWCGPCQMVGPIIEEIAAEREDIIVGKINVDDEMELARQFRIVSIPTIILMKNGEKAYGDVAHLVRSLVYKEHPYQWPTIGKEPAHIENATLDEVKDFFFRFYAPNNAILAVTGNISFEDTVALAEKWFGPIPRRDVKPRNLPVEPQQTEERRLTVERNVPVDALHLVFHKCDRLHPDYYVFDMLSDLLSAGRSSRLIQHLVVERQVFGSVDAYISGSIDAGMFYVVGKLAPGITLEEAEAAVWQELEAMKTEDIAEEELEKVKNRYESEQIFSNINYLNVATNLAFFELIGRAEDINHEVEKYRAVTADRIKEVAKRTFVRENCSVLYYKAKNS